MNLLKSARLALLASALIIALGALTGCASSAPPAGSGAGSTSASTSTGSGVNQQGDKLYTPTYKLNGKESAVIKTNKGSVTVKFYENDAPIASANFIELALKGYYNGIKFHRYVPNFVIQGGDPNTKAATAAAVAAADANQSGQFGSGGPGYAIKDEYANNPNLHVDGALAMARTGAPDSGGSQFYVALGALPGLDHQYTVFGQATSGLDVIHQLRAGDEIVSVTVENASK
jgi:peptidyl-prolyl cis-trans isomerase B (cyclophilin B)